MGNPYGLPEETWGRISAARRHVEGRIPAIRRNLGQSVELPGVPSLASVPMYLFDYAPGVDGDGDWLFASRMVTKPDWIVMPHQACIFLLPSYARLPFDKSDDSWAQRVSSDSISATGRAGFTFVVWENASGDLCICTTPLLQMNAAKRKPFLIYQWENDLLKEGDGLVTYYMDAGSEDIFNSARDILNLEWDRRGMIDGVKVEAQHAMVSVSACLYALWDRNADLTRHEISRTKRLASGMGRAGASYWICSIDPRRATKTLPHGGTHASPRLHMRRGHWRHLQSGKKVFVRETLVGDPDLGVVEKDYRVTA